MKPVAENRDIEHLQRLSAQSGSAIAMENLPRENGTSSLNSSRVQRLLTNQELLLEYSLVIILMGCFYLVLLSKKGLRALSAYEDEISC